MGCVTAWSLDLRSTSKAEAVETCMTMIMIEGLATVGDADFPQTAINISGCGWSNDGGDWSIDTLDDGALPENLHPPLCAARELLNKYNAVVVRTVNPGKRKNAEVDGPEEGTYLRPNAQRWHRRSSP
jgi:hypothetical protein